jgi:cytochrome c-L
MKNPSTIPLLLIAALSMMSCGQDGTSVEGESQIAGKGKEPVAHLIEFASTQDGSSINIKAALFDTPEAMKFASSGKNPYIGQQEAIDKGKKLFQLYSCTQCHGGDAQGQTGPSLHGPDFKYAKDATNKGMFETIWHGTNGGMGAKGKGLMDPADPNNGLMPDEILKIQAWLRSYGKLTGNE